MIKNHVMFILLAAVLVFIFVSAYYGTMYEKAQIKLDKQESKIEALQEENASLHDNVWTLNQELMEEDAE